MSFLDACISALFLLAVVGWWLAEVRYRTLLQAHLDQHERFTRYATQVEYVLKRVKARQEALIEKTDPIPPTMRDKGLN